MKYDFGFTAVSLQLKETLLVARALEENISLDYALLLGSGKSATGKRKLTEFKKRIATLSDAEREWLLEGDLRSQRQLAFIAACRTYAIIRDFMIEVVREKMLIFDYQITEGDYLTFFRRSAELNDQLARLSEATKKKIRQVMFLMLEEGGIIDNTKNKMIQIQFIEPHLARTVAATGSAWLKVLLMPDLDIKTSVI
jgi:hypothetical protein